MVIEKILAYVLSPEGGIKVLSFVLTTLIGLLLDRIFRSKARVVWGTTHGFSFNIPQNNTSSNLTIHTGTVLIQNMGRLPAQDIEIHFNYKPEHLQIWPTFYYEEKPLPGGHHCVYVKNLGKKEWLTIELISAEPNKLPMVLRVRTPDGECSNVKTRLMQVFPRWVYFLYSLFALIGVFYVVYRITFFVWHFYQ